MDGEERKKRKDVWIIRSIKINEQDYEHLQKSQFDETGQIWKQVKEEFLVVQDNCKRRRMCGSNPNYLPEGK